MIGLKKYNIQIFICLIALISIAMPAYVLFGGTIYDDTTIEGDLTISASSTAEGDLSVADDADITDDLTVGGDSIVTGTVQGDIVTDGTTSVTGGNYTGVGNITGSDVDISAGTGDYTSSGKISIDGDTDQVQVTIQAHSVQTADIFVVEKSDGTDYFHVEGSGEIHIMHTADHNDDRTLEIDTDGAGFGDVKSIDIDYTTGAISAGEDEAVILVNIDETAATGGDIDGITVLATEGSADVHGLKAGVGVGPIHHDSGTFANPTTGTDNTTSTDVPAMIDGSTSTTTAIFENDNEYILIGAATAFQELEIILTTGSSGAGIAPTFAYSTAGSHQFTTFSPVDGTNGFRNTGIIAWDASDLASHTTNDDTGTYDIKITRTRNNLSTSPVLGYAKTAATTEYIWDKDGDVNIRNLTASQQVKAEHLYTTDDMYVTDEIQDKDGLNGVTVANLNTSFVHVTSTGADHSYIDQDVTASADVTFNVVRFDTAGVSASRDVTGNLVLTDEVTGPKTLAELAGGTTLAAWQIWAATNEIYKIGVTGGIYSSPYGDGFYFGTGTPVFGDDAVNVLAIETGIAPTSSSVDGVQLYAEDVSSVAKLILRFNGSDGDTTTTDSSFPPHDVTMVATAHIEIDQYKWTTSLQLDGNSDYVYPTQSTDFDFGTGDFTISWWEYPTTDNHLRFSRDAGETGTYSAFMVTGSPGTIYMSSSGSSWDIATVKSLGTVDQNTWTHYAFVRSGTNFYTFKGGVQQATWSSALGLYAGQSALRIGIDRSGYSYFTGYVDEFVVEKGFGRWTTGFTPPTAEHSVTVVAELKVRDESDNVTTLSPHNFELFQPPKQSRFPWSYYAKNNIIGVEINVDMYSAIKDLETVTGKKYIYENSIEMKEITEEKRLALWVKAKRQKELAFRASKIPLEDLEQIIVTDEGGLNISHSLGQLWDNINYQVIDIVASGIIGCVNAATNYLYWNSGTSLSMSTTNPGGRMIVATINCIDNDIYKIDYVMFVKPKKTMFAGDKDWTY